MLNSIPFRTTLRKASLISLSGSFRLEKQTLIYEFNDHKEKFEIALEGIAEIQVKKEFFQTILALRPQKPSLLEDFRGRVHRGTSKVIIPKQYKAEAESLVAHVNLLRLEIQMKDLEN